MHAAYSDWSAGLASTGVGLLEFQAIYAGAADATAVAVRRNQFQRELLTGTGPKLPSAYRLFSIHGAEAFGTTFPEGPGMGASFDYELMRDVGAVIAREARALGADSACAGGERAACCCGQRRHRHEPPAPPHPTLQCGCP